MDLQSLLAAGAGIKQDLVKKSITWENGDDTIEFDVYVKRDSSAADVEFIHLARDLGEDSAVMARRVSRLVRLGNAGEEVIPYEDALLMRPSLLMRMCGAINEVQEPPKKKGNSKKEDAKEVKN